MCVQVESAFSHFFPSEDARSPVAAEVQQPANAAKQQEQPKWPSLSPPAASAAAGKPRQPRLTPQQLAGIRVPSAAPASSAPVASSVSSIGSAASGDVTTPPKPTVQRPKYNPLAAQQQKQASPPPSQQPQQQQQKQPPPPQHSQPPPASAQPVDLWPSLLATSAPAPLFQAPAAQTLTQRAGVTQQVPAPATPVGAALLPYTYMYTITQTDCMVSMNLAHICCTRVHPLLAGCRS